MPVSTVNASILGATGTLRINKRVCNIGDSQFFPNAQWRPIAGLYEDPRVNWGWVFGFRSNGGYINNVVGGFGNPGGTAVQVFPGELMPSPNNAFRNNLPGDLIHRLFVSEVGNFSDFDFNVRVRTPILNGFGGIGDRVRVAHLLTALPNNVDDADSGSQQAQSFTDDDGTVAGATTSQTGLAIGYTPTRSNGTTILDNTSRVLETPGHVLTFTPGGTYYQLTNTLFTFGSAVEAGRTLAEWQTCVRRVDGSDNPLPNRFGFFNFGGGGWRTPDHLEGGYTDTFTKADLVTTWFGTRRWTNEAAQPFLDWYNPEAWWITTDSNDLVDVDSATSRNQHKAFKTELVQRLLALKDIPIVIFNMWPNFFGVNMATYNWASDVSGTGQRRGSEFKWQTNYELAAQFPSRVCVVPLGERINEVLGVPGPSSSGSWAQTHLADQTHTSETGARGSNSFADITLDLLEAGDAAGSSTASRSAAHVGIGVSL